MYDRYRMAGRKRMPWARFRRKAIKFWPLLSRLGIAIAIIGISLLAVRFVPKGLAAIRIILSIPGVVVSYITPTQPHLKSTNGRTNILLLGIAGGQYDGALLTDTIMIASINKDKRDVVFFSLPRDLWISTLNGGAKLNSAYASGEMKRKGGGLILAKSTVSEVLGIPIHYAVRADFAGFERAIDEVGGVTVTIDHNFEDFRYPITGKENDPCDGDEAFSCRYDHLVFTEGRETMNGERALKYVRSRMGTNQEGSDFARSKRQQKVITAFKEKVFSMDTLLNPAKVIGLLTTFGESVETDIRSGEVDDMAKLAKMMRDAVPRSFVLDDSGQSPILVNPSVEDYNGAWVLLPRDGQWNLITDWVREVLAGRTTKQESSLPANEASPSSNESPPTR